MGHPQMQSGVELACGRQAGQRVLSFEGSTGSERISSRIDHRCGANKMPTQTLDPTLQSFLQGRYIATLGTENTDGTIHLTAVWYFFEDDCLFIATSSKTRKARNVVARPTASLMIDARRPGTEHGVTAAGTVDVISGEASRKINRRIHSRYMSAAAMSDPHVEPVFESFDDVTLRLTPVSWTSWDMAALDAQAFGGRLGGTPGYLLPLD